MFKKIVFITVYIFLFFTTEAFADTIYLKNGNKLSGIIVAEDERSVEIKINIGAIVTFSKEDIEGIEKETDLERARIEETWEAEKSKREVEKITEDVFREEQIEKGLVEYKGKWVSPGEKERLQAAGIAKGYSEERSFSSKGERRERSRFATKLLDKGKWFIRETEHFMMLYRDPSLAKMVTDKAEYYFEKITYDLGYEEEIKWDKKCQVYIVEDVAKWKDFLKDIGFNPGLVGGFVPNYGEREMFLCALSDTYLAVTFPHELTHLIFKGIAGNSTIPLWLNEGLANYEASVTSISNKLLIEEIKQSRHILLGDLLRMTRYPEGKRMRELFYAQSEKLVEFLVTQHGREKFRKFCELTLNDRSFSDSLFSAYKGDFEDLEDFSIKLVEYIVK